MGTAGAPPSVEELAERARELAALRVSDRWLTDPVGPWVFHLGGGSALKRLLARDTAQ